MIDGRLKFKVGWHVRFIGRSKWAKVSEIILIKEFPYVFKVEGDDEEYRARDICGYTEFLSIRNIKNRFFRIKGKRKGGKIVTRKTRSTSFDEIYERFKNKYLEIYLIEEIL